VKNRFMVMYDQFFHDVYRYVFVKTGSNKWDTEDIVSETFRKSHEKLHQLQDVQNQKAWLFAIARNTIIDYYKKKRGVPMGEDIELYMSPVSFEDPLEMSAEMDCLKRALHVLPKEELEIVNLRYFAELKYKDVAALLEKPDNSIRVKTMRIIKKLKLLMNQCLGEEV
jgi:RNA polymerase sigma factor (sigma-70 family)